MEGSEHLLRTATTSCLLHRSQQSGFSCSDLCLLPPSVTQSQSIGSCLKLLESRFSKNFPPLPLYWVQLFSGKQAFKLPPLWT